MREIGMVSLELPEEYDEKALVISVRPVALRVIFFKSTIMVGATLLIVSFLTHYMCQKFDVMGKYQHLREIIFVTLLALGFIFSRLINIPCSSKLFMYAKYRGNFRINLSHHVILTTLCILLILNVLLYYDVKFFIHFMVYSVSSILILVGIYYLTYKIVFKEKGQNYENIKNRYVLVYLLISIIMTSTLLIMNYFHIEYDGFHLNKTENINALNWSVLTFLIYIMLEELEFFSRIAVVGVSKGEIKQ